jgi:hypothetical protein
VLKYWKHTACRNYTLCVGITLHVEITLVRVKITLVRVRID